MGGIVSQRRGSALFSPRGHEADMQYLDYTVRKLDSHKLPPLVSTQSLFISNSLHAKLNRLPVSHTIEDLFLNVDVICMFFYKKISENDASTSCSLRHIHLVENMVTRYFLFHMKSMSSGFSIGNRFSPPGNHWSSWVPSCPSAYDSSTGEDSSCGACIEWISSTRNWNVDIGRHSFCSQGIDCYSLWERSFTRLIFHADITLLWFEWCSASWRFCTAIEDIVLFFAIMVCFW